MESKLFKKVSFILLLLLIVPFSHINADEAQNQDRDTYVGVYNDVFVKAFAHYQSLKGHKSFALAADSDKNWAYGLGHNYSKQSDANHRAISECNSRIAKYNVQTSCRLYAIDGNILW